MFVSHLDPMEILRDEQTKGICQKWLQTGSCAYGDQCKYSHLSNDALIQIIEQGKASRVISVR